MSGTAALLTSAKNTVSDPYPVAVHANFASLDIVTPDWIDNSGTVGNRMVTDSSGYLTWAPSNMLLNSATLSTQTVTVTSGATNILSFYGTGSITYSGAASGTLSGTGASDRVSVVLTMTTTSLTVTVSGSVTQAQLERVTYQTQPRAYIPTTSAAVYMPRYDFDGSSSPATPRGMLIEEARSNLLSYSDQFDNAYWAAANATATANQIVSPDGTATADLFSDNSTAGVVHSALRSGITISASSYTLSIYAKNNTRRYLSLRVNDNNTNANAASCVFDLQTGVIYGAATAYGTFSAASGAITNAGNGWYRLALTFTSSATSVSVKYELSDGTARSADGQCIYTGNGSSLYLWGAQLEAGAFATFYIPTTTGSVSRVADVVKLTGTALTTLSSAAASVVVEYANIPAAQISGNAPWSLVGNSGGTNGLIRLNGNTSFQSYAGGVAITATLGSGNFTAASGGRAAVGFNGSGRSIVGGNGTVVSDTNVPSGLSSVVWLGSTGSSTYIGGTVRSLALYNTRLPDAALKTKSAVGAAY